MKELFETLNLKEKLLMIIFEKYTYKIYNHGIKVGFNWNYRTIKDDNVNDLSTMNKIK